MELEKFKNFADILRGYDNINAVPMENGYADRHLFMEELILKADIRSEEIKLPPPNRVQPACWLDEEENIRIEIPGKTREELEYKVGSYQIFIIKKDWSVIRGTKPYKVPITKK